MNTYFGDYISEEDFEPLSIKPSDPDFEYINELFLTLAILKNPQMYTFSPAAQLSDEERTNAIRWIVNEIKQISKIRKSHFN